MKTLLRDYVRQVIAEAIRTRKDIPYKWKGSTKFEWEKFKSLPAQEIMVAYAMNYLDTLGKGSSRIAFALTSKKVLKVAMNPKGIAQNDAEMKIYTDPATEDMVAKIHDADEQNRWLVSDLVRPIKSEAEFKSLSGVDWDEFKSDLESSISSLVREKGAQEISKDAAPFTKKVYKMAEKGKDRLKLGDLIEINHWGKTPDGRVVLLDYGFTEDVNIKHYSEKKKASFSRTAVPGADSPDVGTAPLKRGGPSPELKTRK